MDFSIFDDKVSTTMNVFLVIANIINFVYNIPQCVKTYKTKTQKVNTKTQNQNFMQFKKKFQSSFKNLFQITNKIFLPRPRCFLYQPS